MKLSSSTLCGCCFCCYCHCWLMMLLIVSSVVHVSPEMSTTTTNKKYTKLHNNNYAYQSEMTEFLQLNRKIANRTSSRTFATATLSPLLPSPSPHLPQPPETSKITIPTTTTTDNQYKQKNVHSYRIFEHETITTIATIQAQSTAATTRNTIVASPMQAKTMTSTSPASAPEHIQMTKQPNQYPTTIATKIVEPAKRESKEEEKEGIFYTFDNSIELEDEATTSKTTNMTATYYVADNSSSVVPPKMLRIGPAPESFVRVVTMSKTKQPDYGNKGNKRKNIDKNTKYWNVSIDLKLQQRQQHNGNGSSNSISNSSKNSNKDFTNIINNMNYSNSSSKQKTTNTLSLNHSNRNGTINTTTIATENDQQKQKQHLSTSIENGTTTALDAAQVNSLPSRGTTDLSKNISNSSGSYNFRNHNSNNFKYNNIGTSTDSVSNLSPKEINKYSNETYHHLQIPTSTSVTTNTSSTSASSSSSSLQIRTPATYSALHARHQHHYNQLKRPAFLHRHSRQAASDDEQNERCRMFIEGDPEKNELYSPEYPNDYPKNINCTRVITAPKGQIIRLDFRNSFNIEEKEECKFDFLEIRDGQYGFSNLIGKYCGTDFPPEITSKERYLWLHFHSDESIEYSGFTAVYEFIDRNRDAPSTDLNCTIEKDGSEGFINATDVPTEIKDTVIRNKIPLDCMWRIQVQEKWKIQVKFVEFKLAKPNDCETNFLDIFPEQTVMPLRVKNFCGSAGEGITSESNILHMRFYAEQSAINSTFSILFTAFRERGSGCAEDEYDCEDATCIAGDLKCNGRNNCKFLWDEEGCNLEEDGQSEHMVIIITVFGLILGGMVVTFLVNCIRKIMHDQKIIREHIRQSKESKLDEMGRNSKARSRENLSIVSPRQKHSQTSLQILDDVSNRYYREMELQTKSNFKEKDPSILRHDMIVQTSLCSTDDSSTTTTDPQQQQHIPPAGVASSACDMGCQTRESLFATASLLRQKSKTPSIVGSHRTIEGVPPPPRFSTFGYDAAQIAPPPPPTVSTLSRRNMHLPQESLEMEQLPQQTTHTILMMPHQQQQLQQQQHHQQQQQHQHLHHRPSQEICHHHHQHQQHLQQQQQKQTLPHHHTQQPQHHQRMQQHQQHHLHTSATTIPPNVTQLPPPGTAVVTAISTGSSGRHREQQGTNASNAGGKNKQTKVDESKVFIDIRNSAPDVIIMTSH